MNVDRITFLISSLNLPWLTPIATAINNDVIFLVILLLLIHAAERKWRKRRAFHIFLLFFLSYITAILGKNIFAIPRPCLTLPSKIPCPHSYSYPSGHVLFAATVMLAYIKRREFFLFWVFTFFVAFTRLYLGVHTLADVIASLALSPLIYHISLLLMRWWDARERKG